MAARNVAAGPRPPLADRLTPAQWQALDAVAAVLVALWVVFDLRLRHGFRFELPQAWFGVLGAAVTLPVAVRPSSPTVSTYRLRWPNSPGIGCPSGPIASGSATP